MIFLSFHEALQQAFTPIDYPDPRSLTSSIDTIFSMFSVRFRAPRSAGPQDVATGEERADLQPQGRPGVEGWRNVNVGQI